MLRPLLFAFALLTLAAPALAQSRVPMEGFADLAERLTPAVVNIATSQRVESGAIVVGRENARDESAGLQALHVGGLGAALIAWFNFTGRTIFVPQTTSDALGNTTQNTYDGSGNLLSTTDDGVSTTAPPVRAPSSNLLPPS